MTSQEFRERFEAEADMYAAWGVKVTQTIRDELKTVVLPGTGVDHFLKIPPVPRIKTMDSLLGKAFSRGWTYSDVYAEITDKVGVRFVVLLIDDVKTIGSVVSHHELWKCEKARDFEEDRKKHPTVFDYQSIHYVVYAKSDTDADGIRVAAGTPCEVQIRTLMQHAYSEMSHDAVYKPSAMGTPNIHRALAKSMALIETTDEILKEANSVVKKMHDSATTTLEELDRMYAELVKETPLNDMKTNVFLLSALHSNLQNVNVSAVKEFVDTHSFIGQRIRDRISSRPVFQISAVLFAYYLVFSRRNEAKRRWPLPTTELELIFNDLGIALNR